VDHNCGIADLFTVFAKIVDPAQALKNSQPFSLSALSGLTVGAEEQQAGHSRLLHMPARLADCKIPAANLLGEAGKGHHIAFNVLNVGRFKLGVACIRRCPSRSGPHGPLRQRAHRLRQAISEFGLIQRKISLSAPASTLRKAWHTGR